MSDDDRHWFELTIKSKRPDDGRFEVGCSAIGCLLTFVLFATVLWIWVH